MKKLILTAILVALISTMSAQTITLPAPQTDGGLPTNKALALRHSDRKFDSERQLPLQTVANLLWAACGINRPDTGLRTNPTARNTQEIEVYWFDKGGVYLYDYKQNQLMEIARGDYRNLIAGTEKFRQDFVFEAPASILIVADVEKIGLTAALIDAGIACENVNIFCAANGLATVPRMTMDVNAIQELLSLPESKLPVLNNPVGFPR